MKRISIFVSEPQYKGFLALAEQQDRPYAELIREALDVYLRERSHVTLKKTERKRAVTRRRP